MSTYLTFGRCVIRKDCLTPDICPVRLASLWDSALRVAPCSLCIIIPLQVWKFLDFNHLRLDDTGQGNTWTSHLRKYHAYDPCMTRIRIKDLRAKIPTELCMGKSPDGRNTGVWRGWQSYDEQVLWAKSQSRASRMGRGPCEEQP